MTGRCGKWLCVSLLILSFWPYTVGPCDHWLGEVYLTRLPGRRMHAFVALDLLAVLALTAVAQVHHKDNDGAEEHHATQTRDQRQHVRRQGQV